MNQLGNCQVDNQGTPLPQVGQQCNLAGMHLDASTIDQPDETALFGNGMINNGMLDWEFYGVDPRPSAGANPASQNDFYGNLYSLSSFYGTEGGAMDYSVGGPTMKTIPVPTEVIVDKPCGCEGSQEHSKKQMRLFIGLIVVAYLLAKN